MGATGRRRGPMTELVAIRAPERSRAPGWRPGPVGWPGMAGLFGVAPGPASGAATSVAATSGAAASSAAVRASAAFRRALVYWFQCVLHIRPRPSFWLGWAGLGWEVGDRRLVRLDPELRRSDAPSRVSRVGGRPCGGALLGVEHRDCGGAVLGGDASSSGHGGLPPCPIERPSGVRTHIHHSDRAAMQGQRSGLAR